MATINIAIVGVGRWGVNYLRAFNELENASVKWICSPRKSTLDDVSKRIGLKPYTCATTDYETILKDKDVDAVAIATPGSTHYELACKALLSGKHALVEKPMTLSSMDAKKLIKISEKSDKILMVGHVHVFNPGIQKLKSDIQSGLFGKINFIHFSHFGNGPVRSDMGAIWDFFPHSASILLHLLEDSPLTVSANGASYIKRGIEDIATMDIMFPKNIFAASVASWLYPLKKMEVVVSAEKRYAIFDDYANERKLRYYDRIKDDSYTAPEISNEMPLTLQLKHFLDCIGHDKTPITDGHNGFAVVKILEAAQKSLKDGKTIALKR